MGAVISPELFSLGLMVQPVEPPAVVACDGICVTLIDEVTDGVDRYGAVRVEGHYSGAPIRLR